MNTFNTIVNDVKTYFTSENLSKFFWIALSVILIVIVGKIVLSIINKIIDSYGKRNKDKLLALNFLKKIIKILMWIIIIFASLDECGLDVAPILATLGAASLILGFAFQETITNFFSGIFLIVKKPFRVGDYVDLNGIAGTVSDIDMLATELVTPDNKRINLNNKAVWNSAITNFSFVENRRVDMSVCVAYGSDLDKVRKIINQIIVNIPEILKEPETTIAVGKLNDSSVDFIVRPWVKTQDYWKVYWTFQEQVYKTLNKENIGIPFPQLDVHLIKD